MPFPVACHSCSTLKGPLLPCHACGSEAQPAEERAAWREAVRRHHLALLTADPAAATSETEHAPSAPRRIVISLAQAQDAVRAELGRLVSGGDDDGDGSTPLSFDWHDRRRLRRLRRTA
jgi:hypothetical protein